MSQNIILFNEIVLIDLFTSFGLYSLLYLILSIFIKNSRFHQFDEKAKKLITYIGVLFISSWILSVFLYYFESNKVERVELINRMFGKYWFGIWIQPIFWFSLSQIFRFKYLSKNVFIRFFASIFLIISIEKFIILTTSLHRDYLPSSWTMYRESEIFPSNFILSILMKIFFFVCLVQLYSYLSQKINYFKKSAKDY